MDFLEFRNALRTDLRQQGAMRTLLLLLTLSAASCATTQPARPASAVALGNDSGGQWLFVDGLRGVSSGVYWCRSVADNPTCKPALVAEDHEAKP